MRIPLFLLLLAAPGAFAQPAIDLGVRIGANLSEVTGNDALDASSSGRERRAGFEAALVADFALSDAVTVTGEIGYARRRHAQSFEETVRANNEAGFVLLRSTLGMSHDIGSLGALIRVGLPGRGALSPYLTLGPRLDVLLNTDTELTLPDDPLVGIDSGAVERAEDFYSDRYSDVSLSGVAGVGVEIGRMAGPAFRVEARYDRTLTNFLDAGAAHASLTGFAVSAALVF